MDGIVAALLTSYETKHLDLDSRTINDVEEFSKPHQLPGK
jgi:hypothetical protein